MSKLIYNKFTNGLVGEQWLSDLRSNLFSLNYCVKLCVISLQKFRKDIINIGYCTIAGENIQVLLKPAFENFDIFFFHEVSLKYIVYGCSSKLSYLRGIL